MSHNAAEQPAAGAEVQAPHDPFRSPEDRYATRPPWDIGRPQPAFLALARAGAVQGRVLDAGCGTGEHALMAASLGLDATGIDLAANALEAAREKARARRLSARFLLHDAVRLAELGESFDTVLDCGLFHIFDDQKRTAYVESLRSAVPGGGRYFMLGFSDRESRWPGRGPRRLTREEIEAAFADGWRIDSIETATIDISIDPATAARFGVTVDLDSIMAWLVAGTRMTGSDEVRDGAQC